MGDAPHDSKHERLRSALVRARDGARLTQAEVAARLDRPQSFVSKYETGERRLDVVEFVAVCNALGVDPADVIRSIESKGRSDT